MSKPVKPDDQAADSSSKKEDALIFTPISIARARHASTHKPSVIADAKSSTPPAASQPTPSAQPQPLLLPTFLSDISLLNGANGCLLMSLAMGALVVAGMLGGFMGGGLMLWANTRGVLVLANDTPTPTLTPSPIPSPTVIPTPTAPPQPTPAIEDVIASLIPSVVTVINQQHNSFTNADEGRVVGTGVVIDSRGYIATNNHVVDTPQDLRIILADGREVTAELIAANPAEDLAILKIDVVDLPEIEWASSNPVRPGQAVYAIGSPLGDFPGSVSRGIVSGLNRALEIDKYVIDGLIQTDAAINRGSSGGPLINLEGKVVGINTFIIRESEERGIAEGIAFAIPADTAKNLLIPWIAAHTGESVPIPASEETN